MINYDRVFFILESEPVNITLRFISKFLSFLEENTANNKGKTLLLIRSSGGDPAAFRLLGSYLNTNRNFDIVVCKYSLSSAVLAVLSANKIFMDTSSYLSPCDPQTVLLQEEVDGSQKFTPISMASVYAIEKVMGLVNGDQENRVLHSNLVELLAQKNIETISHLCQSLVSIRVYIRAILSYRKPSINVDEVLEVFCNGGRFHYSIICVEELKQLGFEVKKVNSEMKKMESLLSELFETEAVDGLIAGLSIKNQSMYYKGGL